MQPQNSAIGTVLLIAPHRRLGLAFASADLLVEVSPEGKIEFAVGAAAILGGYGERVLIGRGWREFVDPRDQGPVESLFLGIEDAARQGPIVARLAGSGAQRGGVGRYPRSRPTSR
jgi:hypothetical protein